MRLDEPDPVSLTSEVGADSVVLEGWLARIVPPLVSQPPSSSSSARSAKTSGSSSSGGSVDIQHIRAESNIMFPTIRAPFPNEPTGEPMDELVRWVIRAGRVEVPTASKSRRAWSLPSQRRAVGFHFISPTTKEMLTKGVEVNVDRWPLTFGCRGTTRIPDKVGLLLCRR